jgi:hypothetical protein
MKKSHMLKESLDLFVAPAYGRTQRTADTYRTVAERCRKKLKTFCQEYRETANNPQLLREIRNDIDDSLRRYHSYCVKERDGMAAHYYELGADSACDFEHLIPAARLRDLLLAQVISIDQALNAPTVRLSRHKHHQLKEAGWASQTPDMWLPFRRYSAVFRAEFQTYDGTAIDTETWTLAQHYQYFQHLTI